MPAQISQPVEVRTWPQGVEVYLVDPEQGTVLAHYPLDPDFSTAAFDPLAPYAERAADALQRLERDQDSLRAHWQLDAGQQIALVPDERMRDVLRETLAGYGLELEQLELRYLLDDYDWLTHLGAEDLYRLLTDWIDVAERHYPPGASVLSQNPEHWTKRSQPALASHFHHLVGLEHSAGTPSADEAYERFLALVDVPLEQFTFAYLLRWVFYHLTEFADRDERLPKALARLRQPVAA
jgi:hypothetical protein